MNALLLTIPSSDREEIITDKGPITRGTCQWIEKVDKFESWLKGPTHHLLWISGGPGKGKTFLSIYLAQNLSMMASEVSQTPLVLEYFCDNRDNRRNTRLAVLRGLLYQLLKADNTLYEDILPEFELWQARSGNLFSDAHVDELWGIFKKMINKVPGQIYFVLDGLDECDGATIKFIKAKLEVMYSASDRGESRNIKTVIVSRRLATIVENALWIDLDLMHRQEREEDLKAFTSSRVASLFTIPGDDEWQAPLERILLERAGGTFLWIGLAIQVLTEDPAEVQKILDSESSISTRLPAGLDAMYNRMLLDIPENQREVAARVVRWVSIAFRPLTVAELCTATRVKLSEMRIQIYHCRHLLSLTEDKKVQDKKVQLVHLSLKDYLLDIPSLSFSVKCTFGIQEEKAHKDVYMMCLELMQTLEKDKCKLRLPGALASEAKSKVEEYLPSIVQYACCYWVDHLKRSDIELSDNDDVHSFLKEHFLHWLEALSLMGRMSDSVSMVTVLQSIVTVSKLLTLSYYLGY